MRNLILKWWHDDNGAVIASEYLFLATIMVVGIIVGLTNVRDAVRTEMTELANSYLALSQGYAVAGQVGCCASTDGSMAIDTPYVLPQPVYTPAYYPSSVDAWPNAPSNYGWPTPRGAVVTWLPDV
jgi:Flp pilus assembly pilin Flp